MVRRPFNRTTAPRTIFFNQKVNTAEVKAVSAVGGEKGKLLLSPQQVDNPQRALKNKGIVDSGCSRHMTGNKDIPCMCDKKNKVLFTDTECLVLSSDFKLPDENQVLLRIPRQNNMYSFNLENIVPSGGLACLIAKATIDESNKWHRRLKEANHSAGTQDNIDAGNSEMEAESAQDYFVLPIWSSFSYFKTVRAQKQE
ncbi:hypothetical protein Tco_0971321 [Tanacetum coccineum]